jgi:hypothetical protein
VGKLQPLMGRTKIECAIDFSITAGSLKSKK